MAHVYILFFKGKSIKTAQRDTDALGHPQQPRQAQLRRVQKVPVMIIEI